MWIGILRSLRRSVGAAGRDAYDPCNVARMHQHRARYTFMISLLRRLKHGKAAIDGRLARRVSATPCFVIISISTMG